MGNRNSSPVNVDTVLTEPLNSSERIDEKPNPEIQVDIRKLRKSYFIGKDHEVEVIRNISLSEGNGALPVRRGEFLIIRGPSGSGKTSLLNIIGTIDDPTDGEVFLFGHLVKYLNNDAELANIRLSYVRIEY